MCQIHSYKTGDSSWGLGQGFQRCFQRRVVSHLRGQLRGMTKVYLQVPSSCPLAYLWRRGTASNPPAWHAFRESIHELSTSFQERADTGLDRLCKQTPNKESPKLSPLPDWAWTWASHPTFCLPSPGLARILLRQFIENHLTRDI